MQLAVLTPPPDYAGEWRWAYDVEADALTAAGASVEPVPWTEAEAGSLDRFDLILPLVAWGYHERYSQWRSLLDRIERDALPMINPVPLLRWNSDKAYLAELGDQGIATVPTIAVDALDETALAKARDRFGCTELVIKPPISASAFGTFRLGPGTPLPEQVRGWRMMIQPWLGSIVDQGEYSLLFFGGRLSHAVRKVPRAGEFRVQPEYGGIVTPCEPPPGAEQLARTALDAGPAAAQYARVDLIVGNEGELQIIELELIEPALWLDHAPDGGAAFARAIVLAAERSTK